MPTPDVSEPLLDITGLTLRFGGVHALMTLQLVRWVENGVAPTEVDVTYPDQGVTRPVYPYPRIPSTTEAVTPRSRRASTRSLRPTPGTAITGTGSAITCSTSRSVGGEVDVPTAAGEEGGRRR